MLKFFVKNQKIEILECEPIASGQIQFVTLQFIFEGNWNPLHKVVQFTQHDKTCHAVLGTDGLACKLPSELCPGKCRMSVFGYLPDNTEALRATTIPVILHIRPSGFTQDSEVSIPPEPDLYQQLLAEIDRKIESGATSGVNGKNGLSAYEIAVQNGFTGSESDWLTSLQGEPGKPGIDGKNGTTGINGLSAYEIAVRNGFSGSESDWLTSLKGEPGNQGEKGECGLQGEKGNPGENGKDGIDGFSPEIVVCENTDSSYKLRITDRTGSFETPNLKGKNGKDGTDGTSGGESNPIIIDAELSEISGNPIQNRVISGEVLSLRSQISNLNDLIATIQTGGRNLKIMTLFDSSDYETYKNSWSFRSSHWDDRIFSFEETMAENSAFCNEENEYSMRFSNSFGWGADVTALCSKPVRISDKSILVVHYHCSSDGDGITAEIIPEADFTSQKTAEFKIIPAFYAVNTFLSANFKLQSPAETSGYLRFRLNTTNPVFTIRKIIVIGLE